MEPGRQRLSQRRKAAALHQGARTDWPAAPPLTEAMARVPSAVAETPTRALPSAAPPRVPPSRAPSERLTRSPIASAPEPTRTGQPNPAPPAAIPARWRWRWQWRFPAAGVLATVFTAGVVSVMLIPSHRAPVSPDAAAAPAPTLPVVTIPEPELSETNPPAEDHVQAAQPAPVKVSDQPAVQSSSPPVIPTSKAPDVQSRHPVVVPRKPAVAPTMTAPPDNRPTRAEILDAWARASGFDANDPRWERFRQQQSPHREPERPNR